MSHFIVKRLISRISKSQRLRKIFHNNSNIKLKKKADYHLNSRNITHNLTIQQKKIKIYTNHLINQSKLFMRKKIIMMLLLIKPMLIIRKKSNKSIIMTYFRNSRHNSNNKETKNKSEIFNNKKDKNYHKIILLENIENSQY